MPRERRYTKDIGNEPEPVSMDFINKTATAVNLLLHIYDQSITDKANIADAQAEGNREIIVSYLNDVRHFIDEQIKTLKQL